MEAGRIRFGIDPLYLYGAWCNFVSPFPNNLVPSGYGCGTNGGGRQGPTLDECQFDAPDPVDVDCGIYELCVGEGVCTCTATACGPHVIAADGTSLDSYPIVVDAAIDATGSALTGTLAMKDGAQTQRITIRMLK